MLKSSISQWVYHVKYDTKLNLNSIIVKPGASREKKGNPCDKEKKKAKPSMITIYRSPNHNHTVTNAHVGVICVSHASMKKRNERETKVNKVNK